MNADDTMLRLHRNPVRLVLSASPWLSAWYLGGYLFVTGWVLFSVALTAVITAASFAITLAGIPLLAAAASVVRGCADAERRRVRRILPGPVHGSYREPTQPGLIARAKASWRDRAIWRDLSYLVGLWPPLAVLDTVVISVWVTLLAGITLPVWYWAPRGNAGVGYINGATVHGVALGYFPHGATGPGSVGVFIDTLPKALLVAAAFAVAFLLFTYVLVITARAQARIARSLLRAPADPLAEAKEVLDHPGPLGPLHATTTRRR
jgi:putative sensor protein